MLISSSPSPISLLYSLYTHVLLEFCHINSVSLISLLTTYHSYHGIRFCLLCRRSCSSSPASDLLSHNHFNSSYLISSSLIPPLSPLIPSHFLSSHLPIHLISLSISCHLQSSHTQSYHDSPLNTHQARDSVQLHFVEVPHLLGGESAVPIQIAAHKPSGWQ
jgi:hypothetical protein